MPISHDRHRSMLYQNHKYLTRVAAIILSPFHQRSGREPSPWASAWASARDSIRSQAWHHDPWVAGIAFRSPTRYIHAIVSTSS